MKYCIDCANFRRADKSTEQEAIEFGRCAAFFQESTGNEFLAPSYPPPTMHYASIARKQSDKCGPTAKQFKAAPIPQAAE